MSQLDLFNVDVVSVNDPFKQWTIETKLAENSVTIYRSMWKRFVRDVPSWKTANALTISSFLHTSEMSGQHTLRYLHLLEGVYSQLVLSGEIKSNPVKIIDRTPWRKLARNKPVVHPCVSIQSAKTESRSEWKVLRDNALVAIAFYAGLRNREVIQLNRSDVLLQQSAMVIRSRELQSRIIELPEEAIVIIRKWMTFLNKVPGEYLFTSTLAGAKMDPSTAWRRIKAAFDAGAGFSSMRNRRAILDMQTGNKLQSVMNKLDTHDVFRILELKRDYLG